MIETGSYNGKIYEVDLSKITPFSFENKKICGVYAISGSSRHLQSEGSHNCLYVGSSIDIKRRMGDHLYTLSNRTHHNEIVQGVWNKEGSNTFAFFVLEVCNEDERHKKEQYWIDYFSDKYGFDVLMNLSDEVGLPPKMTEEERRKLSEVRKGNWAGEKNPQYGRNMKGENNVFFGKHHSEQVKQKLAEIAVERFKINPNPFKGKRHSKETRRILSEKAKQRKPMSIETKAKLSEKGKGRVYPNLRKPVAKLDAATGLILEIYPSCQDAALATGIDQSSISRVCRKKPLKGYVNKMAGGYKWAFLGSDGSLIDPASFIEKMEES